MGKNPAVVVLTDRRDAHLPFVQAHLDDQLIIIDPRSLLEEAELSYEVAADGTTRVLIDDVALADVSGAWFRKPMMPSPDELPVADEFAPYSASAIAEHYVQLFATFPLARWVSDYYAIRRASNKLHQLAVARRIGLPTLPTLFTSHSERARTFIRSHQRVVSKPISIVHPTVDGQQKVLFTVLVEADDMPDLGNLHLAPSIFQVAPHVECDLRITVVGDQVFPATVVTSGTAEFPRVYDSRVGNYEGGLEIAEAADFPPALARGCVRLVKELGLAFGAIDMIRDHDGAYWFLEINPNGQWAYIENATGQSIGNALAQYLAGYS